MLFTEAKNGLVMPLKEASPKTKTEYISSVLEDEEAIALASKCLDYFRQATRLNYGSSKMTPPQTKMNLNLYKSLHDHISTVLLGKAVDYETYC